MKTTNAMQLKARLKAKAQTANVSPQLMLQDYLLERLLERLSLSSWRSSVVVKGGMLISSLVGVESRVTKDLDATARGFALTHDSAERAFREICAVEVDDDIAFEFVRTEDIREADEYPGIRVFVRARYGSMAVPLSIDLTTGDAITPEAVEYAYPLMFDEGFISLSACPVETCMAEKLETVISRGVANTRLRDYYDIVMLWRTRRDVMSLDTLYRAFEATATRRGSLAQMRGYAVIMDEVASDSAMLARWKAYAGSYSYVGDMKLEAACKTVVEVVAMLHDGSTEGH